MLIRFLTRKVDLLGPVPNVQLNRHVKLTSCLDPLKRLRLLAGRPPLLHLSLLCNYFILVHFSFLIYCLLKWSEFLATDTEVPGSIPGATRFSE